MLTVGLFGILDTTYDGSATYTHDHGLALMRDGVVLTTIELERYTGRKHDNRLGQFIGALLAPWLRPGEDVRFVSANSFVGDTFISNDGNLRVEPASQVGIDEILYPARCVWYPDGLHPRPAEAWIIAHEFAHVAAALPFCSSFPKNALLVHVDGGASRSACSFWHWNGGQARCLHHAWDDLKDVVNNFNVSPLARAILNEPPSAHLALPGKLMGYAAHGRCDDPTYAWLKENRWFLDYAGSEADLLHRVNSRRAKPATRFDTHDAGFMNLAAGLQRAFEEAVVTTILGFARRIGSRHLVYAGGAALNITTNRLLVESGQFESIFIPPPANDAGLALGAAAWVEFLERGRLAPHGPFLNRFGLEDPDADVHADVDEVAQAIVAGKVVGIATGGAEIGPRALGHRSLLARADDPELRRHVSEQIKKREWYRPLAPVLCEPAARVVLGPQAAEASISRYMLGSWTVRDDFAAGLAGVLHHDGTVRAQVVPSGDPDNRFLDRLLRLLWEQHGLPGLINTSFNVKGQPIVHRPEDAENLGRQMGLDAVVLPDRFVRL
jgi:carbamoyltransferase